jgi:dTDP-4-dehydrorhamnose reductase
VKILLTGSNGQLGLALQQRLAGVGEVLARPRAQLDLADPAQIRSQVRELQPQLIINAGAYTAVDRAEGETDLAWRINAEGPGVLAEEACALGVPLIHFSTDYVFDGTKPAAYREDDATAPLNAYGRSKLAGEQAIAAIGAEHLILRTSWVYSMQGSNFLLSMLRLLQERDELRVVADQIGAPTWTQSIADACLQLVRAWQSGTAGPWGLYHMTAAGETSWYGFASAIAQYLQMQRLPCARLIPIPTSDYPTPARRPANSRLDCSRLRQDWGVELPPWQLALQACLDQQPPARVSTAAP